MKKLICAFALFLAGSSAAWSQARPSADRVGDLQVGGGYSIANSDYVLNHIRGWTGYADFDWRAHYGVEVDFHQLNDPNANSDVYERSYEVGGRYMRRYGIAKPYVRGMYGRGVFNFPHNNANLAYNMVVIAGGADFSVHPRINVRAEYEYQHWFGFPPHGLQPQLVTIGVAYHFPAGNPHGVLR